MAALLNMLKNNRNGSAESIGKGLAKAVVAGKVNGTVRDLSYKLSEDCTLVLLKFDDPEGQKYWHTASRACHAVKRLYPNVKLAIGLPLTTALLRF